MFFFKIFVPSKSLCFLSSVEILSWNPTGPQSKIPWGFSVPLLDPQVEKSVVEPRIFATVWELLCCNCSPVCGSPAWWLCCGANCSLLQEDLYHRLSPPGLLQQEPLSTWQATADMCLCKRHSNTQRQVWLSISWRSAAFLGPGWHKALFVPFEHLWQVWDLIFNVTAPLLLSGGAFSFAVKCGVSFFGGIQHSPVNGVQKLVALSVFGSI